MRTLDELLTAAEEAKNGYSASVQRAEQERQLLHEALSAARAVQEDAAASGNRAAYDKAHSDEKYASARLSAIAQPKPFFTREENNAFAAEVEKAYIEAVKPAYQTLLKLSQQWKETLNSISDAAQKVHSIGTKLAAAHPNERGYNASYNHPIEYLDHRLKIHDGQAVYAVETFLERHS